MREIKLVRKITNEGPDYRVSLYDELGRFVLTARFYAFGTYEAELVAAWLDTGAIGVFAQRAIRLSRSMQVSA